MGGAHPTKPVKADVHGISYFDAIIHHIMRTTLPLDDDLAVLFRNRAKELGISFKEIVNRVIRSGLGENALTPNHPIPKTIPHSFGFNPGLDLDKLNQFTDELESEEFLKTFQRRMA